MILDRPTAHDAALSMMEKIVEAGELYGLLLTVGEQGLSTQHAKSRGSEGVFASFGLLRELGLELPITEEEILEHYPSFGNMSKEGKAWLLGE